MTEGLRLMIYDTTDLDTVARSLKEMTPDFLDPLDEAIDRLDLELGLSTSWWAGGWLFRKLRRFDYVKGFDSWQAALTWAAEVEPDRPIAEIQYWGHGSPGKVWLNGAPLHHRSFTTLHLGPLLKCVKARLTPGSLIWFRVCSAFCASRGQQFAKAWADNMDCTIAAHTHIIGLFQAGLHTISPGEAPSWGSLEGVVQGSADRPEKIKWSQPWDPNSIFCLRSEIPEGW